MSTSVLYVYILYDIVLHKIFTYYVYIVYYP